MFVLGLDFETTGVDPRKDDIIEVGAVVWDVDKKKPAAIYSDLIPADRPLSDEVMKVTGLTDDDLRRFGQPQDVVFKKLSNLAGKCQYIVAHNGNKFDKLFLERLLQQQPLPNFNLPWIDTLTDIPYPDSIVTRKLSYLAAEHGFLNMFNHRAVFDVLTMMKVVSQYDFNHILKTLNSPMLKIVAQVTYDEKAKAKDMGFRWDPNQRVWYMEIRRAHFEARQFPFPTSVV